MTKQHNETLFGYTKQGMMGYSSDLNNRLSSVNHPDEPYGKIPKDKTPQPKKLKRVKHNSRLQAIDSEINGIKEMLDNTYNIDRQINLSKCLVTLYTLKKEVLEL